MYMLWIIWTAGSILPSSLLLLNRLGHAGFQKIHEKEIATCALVSTEEEVQAVEETYELRLKLF